MQRYRMLASLAAVQISPRDGGSERAGTMALLPRNATVEVSGTSRLGPRMIEISWRRHMYAVFEFDFKTRATLQPDRQLSLISSEKTS